MPSLIYSDRFHILIVEKDTSTIFCSQCRSKNDSAQFWDAKKGVLRRTCIECREILFLIMYLTAYLLDGLISFIVY